MVSRGASPALVGGGRAMIRVQRGATGGASFQEREGHLVDKNKAMVTLLVSLPMLTLIPLPLSVFPPLFCLPSVRAAPIVLPSPIFIVPAELTLWKIQREDMRRRVLRHPTAGRRSWGATLVRIHDEAYLAPTMSGGMGEEGGGGKKRWWW